jgi:hypothetical protein
MPPKSKEEIAKGRAELQAKELAIKKEYCALEGHKWDTPAASPFNHDMLECEVICRMCNAHGDLKITVRPDPVGASAPPPAAAKAVK